MGTDGYDVFISYSRADARYAADIDSVLRQKGLRTFFDRRNLAPGLPWVPALEEAIGAAKAATVLLGPTGFGNTQQYERQLALVRQTQVRAARALLGWTVRDLAHRAVVSVSTVNLVEGANGLPNTSVGQTEAIRVALEAAGIEFLNGGVLGVQLHAKPSKRKR